MLLLLKWSNQNSMSINMDNKTSDVLASISLESNAKINLLLKILSKDQRNYHNLITYFQFIDYADRIYFKLEKKNTSRYQQTFVSLESLQIHQQNQQLFELVQQASQDFLQDFSLNGFALDLPKEQNLIYKAIRVLLNSKITALKNLQANLKTQQEEYINEHINKQLKCLFKTLNTHLIISVHKNLPLQGGLAGGSSNASICALAVNKLLKLEFNQQELCNLMQQVGADCSIFIRQKSQLAWAYGQNYFNNQQSKNLYNQLAINLFPRLQLLISKLEQVKLSQDTTIKVDLEQNFKQQFNYELMQIKQEFFAIYGLSLLALFNNLQYLDSELKSNLLSLLTQADLDLSQAGYLLILPQNLGVNTESAFKSLNITELVDSEVYHHRDLDNLELLKVSQEYQQVVNPIWNNDFQKGFFKQQAHLNYLPQTLAGLNLSGTGSTMFVALLNQEHADNYCQYIAKQVSQGELKVKFVRGINNLNLQDKLDALVLNY